MDIKEAVNIGYHPASYTKEAVLEAIKLLAEETHNLQAMLGGIVAEQIKELQKETVTQMAAQYKNQLEELERINKNQAETIASMRGGYLDKEKKLIKHYDDKLVELERRNKNQSESIDKLFAEKKELYDYLQKLMAATKEYINLNNNDLRKYTREFHLHCLIDKYENRFFI